MKLRRTGFLTDLTFAGFETFPKARNQRTVIILAVFFLKLFFVDCNPMKILITGATGFIGSCLSKALVDRHKVFALSRSIETESTENGLEAVNADLSHSGFAKKLPPDVDSVIHLAQSEKYRDFPDGVADMCQVNINATLELLEWARRTGVKHFVFASSANVYEETTSTLSEGSKALPNSFYGASKLSAEHLALQYKEFFQVDILRFFTVYGPFQTGMLIPNIIDRSFNDLLSFKLIESHY